MDITFDILIWQGQNTHMKKLNESSSYLEQSTITLDDFTTLRSHESIISDETLKMLEDKLKLK